MFACVQAGSEFWCTAASTFWSWAALPTASLATHVSSAWGLLAAALMLPFFSNCKATSCACLSICLHNALAILLSCMYCPLQQFLIIQSFLLVGGHCQHFHFFSYTAVCHNCKLCPVTDALSLQCLCMCSTSKLSVPLAQPWAWCSG